MAELVENRMRKNSLSGENNNVGKVKSSFGGKSGYFAFVSDSEGNLLIVQATQANSVKRNYHLI